ncbi:MAG: diguanylate cyclase [Pseudomonadota bacterium]
MNDLPLSAALLLLEHCPMAMLLEEQGRIGYFNRAFADLLGAAADGLGRDPQPEALITPLLATSSLVSWVMPDGDERWFAVETVSVSDRPDMIVRFYQDHTERLRLKQERDALAVQLARQSMRDQKLPGLLSKYGLQVTLEPMVSRCRRYNHPLTVVAMSLVSNPQQERERALIEVAHLLKDQTRWADLIGCNGDYDFVLVLQETTQDAALQLVDKLADQVAGLSGSLGAELQACFGITQCQKHDDADSMLERAEAALLEARSNESGRSIAV